MLSDAALPIDDGPPRRLIIELAEQLENLAPKRGLWSRGEPEDQPAVTRAVAARQIRVELESNKLNVGQLLAMATGGDRSSIRAAAEERQLNADLLWTLLQFAMRPFFHAWREQLTPLLGDLEWNQARCYVCGGDAIIGELRGNEQAAHVRCVLCGADWSVLRLRCVHCGNEDHNTLSYLYPEGRREKWRVQVCDRCKGYLRIQASFEPTRPEFLLVEDLAMLHLDAIAQAQGYTRTTA